MATLQQTREQNQLAESGQFTDRFNAAVRNLGSGTATVRIGGIYALQRIKQGSPRDEPAVVQVLAAFIREQALFDKTPSNARARTARLAIDVQTALTVPRPQGDAPLGADLVGAVALAASGSLLRGQPAQVRVGRKA